MEFLANDLAYGVRPGPALWSVARMRAMKQANRQGSSLSHFLSEALLLSAGQEEEHNGGHGHSRGGYELQSARSVFDKYDTDGDGVLNTLEVAAMLDALNYDVDANYISDIMGQFGQFDTSGDGVIDITEFPRLWEHLDGEPLAELEPELASAAFEMPPGMSAEDAAIWPSECLHHSSVRAQVSHVWVGFLMQCVACVQHFKVTSKITLRLVAASAQMGSAT
jgi:hypothetical protein